MLLFSIFVITFAFINQHFSSHFEPRKQIASNDQLFQNGGATPKMTIKAILRVIVVRITTKDTIVDKMNVDNEDIF